MAWTDRHIELACGCWIWQGGVFPNGYGQRSWGGRDGFNSTAHACYWRHYVGDIPSGLELDHLCQVKLCVNPDHMELVTRRENVLREKEANGMLRYRPDIEAIEYPRFCPSGHDTWDPLVGLVFYWVSAQQSPRLRCKRCMRRD